jgi:hypothetical protein
MFLKTLIALDEEHLQSWKRQDKAVYDEMCKLKEFEEA